MEAELFPPPQPEIPKPLLGFNPRDITQSKAFLRWTNIVLSKHPGSIAPIDDLFTAIQGGVVLCRLAEVVIPTTLRISPPKNDLQKVQTITLALDAFEKAGTTLVNIHSSALARGDSKAILGLLFQLCIRYQVQGNSSGPQSSVSQLKEQLISWVNNQLGTLKPEDTLAIRAFTDVYTDQPLQCCNLEKDLVNGTILMGLIASLSHPYSSQIIAQMHDHFDAAQASLKLTPEAQDRMSPAEATLVLINSIAMSTALNVLEIPLLMDPEDIVLNCDGNANLAYLSYFKNFPGSSIALTFDSVQVDPTATADNALLQTDFIPEPPANVETITTFDPNKEYDDDIVLYI